MIHQEILCQTTILENNIKELTYNITHSGGCQCFSNCDCSDKKGTILYQVKFYSHSSLLNKVGKEKIYKSLHVIQNALKNKKDV